MTLALSLLAFVAAAVLMEFVAWFTHKYVMHGFLWVLHEDHHHPKGRGLQKNDLFAVFFAALSFLLIYNGLLRAWYPMAALGFGIALYGVAYTLFHEVMFHRRVRWLRIRARGPYLRRIVDAHRAHHREGDTHFGFLYAPPADEAAVKG